MAPKLAGVATASAYSIHILKREKNTHNKFFVFDIGEKQ